MSARGTNAEIARLHLGKQVKAGPGSVLVLFNPGADHFSFAARMREPFEPFAGNRLATVADLNP